MAKLSDIELKRARLVPSSVFADPDAVVQSDELNRAQKIAILRRWEFDTRQMHAAGEALFQEEVRTLDQVRRALASLEPALSPHRRSASLIRH